MDVHISKKELLELTGISYGQLYRWKRMDIIPENWFIKKASYTGQETYFPKEKILERVNKVIELKDEYSLEELAKFFSPKPSEIELSEEALREILSEKTLREYNANHPNIQSYPFEIIYYLYICQEVARTTTLPIEKCYQILNFIRDYYNKHNHVSLDLVALDKNQELIWIMVPIQTPIVLENQAKVVHTFQLLELMNDLKMKLSGILNK